MSPGGPVGPGPDVTSRDETARDETSRDDLSPSIDDDALVTELLGRPPAGAFDVVVRAENGVPAVIANAPFLHDGTPMPTRYWLVDPALREGVSRIGSSPGGRGGYSRGTSGRCPCPLRGGTRHSDIQGPPGTAAVRGCRWHQARGEMPPRSSGLVADGGRRPGWGVDSSAHRTPPLLRGGSKVPWTRMDRWRRSTVAPIRPVCWSLTSTGGRSSD